jgi:lambda family phage portal protein
LDNAAEKPRIRVKALTRPVTADLARPKTSAAYMRGETGPTFGGWRPALREARDDTRSAWRMAAARAIDLIHNSGFISGIVDQSAANVVGTGLRLNLTPDAEALGMTKGEAQTWARRVESRFALWSRTSQEVDAENRRSFGAMQVAAYKHWMAFGEVLATVPWERRPGRMFGTKIRLLPAHHISQDSDDLKRLSHGVYLDGLGAPVAYALKQKTTAGIESTRRVDARDEFGRPVIIHAFDGPVGAVRGITPFVPVLQTVKQFGQLGDATLVNAIIHAVFAATIEGDFPTTDILRALQSPQEQAMADQSPVDSWFEGSAGWYQNTHVDLGVAGKFVHLYPGQKLTFHGAQTPGPDYEKFAGFLLREIARCAGMTFESATGDYRQATYSSIRMATADIYPLSLQRRAQIVAPFCQGGFEAWLEEDIASGKTPFPNGIDGFLENRTAASLAEWRGTGKPQADDKKTAEAHRIWKELGVITDEMICGDLGLDVEDVYDGQVREREMRRERKLPEFQPRGSNAPADKPEQEDNTNG